MLPGRDIERLGEIDRSEHIRGIYRMRGGRLVHQPHDFQVPPWDAEGDGPHSVGHHIAEWRHYLDDGGTLFGAFDGERLSGIAIHAPEVRPRLGQLAVLYVSRPYRSRGVGRLLVDEVLEAARDDQAARICVSSSETDRTVDFYRRVGFELDPNPLQELVELEPEDIQLSMAV